MHHKLFILSLFNYHSSPSSGGRMFFSSQCHQMSLMDFVVSPPGCVRSVTDFWGWDAHEALFRCPDKLDRDTWIWSTRRGLNLSYTKLLRPWSPWESCPSRKNPHGRTMNWTRDLMISSQKLWPLEHEAGPLMNCIYSFPMPPHVRYGLRGLPSWLWLKCNWLLRLGRPWGAVTCPDEVDGDIWIWSARGLNLSYTKLPRPWSPWEPSSSRKNPHGKSGNEPETSWSAVRNSDH
jgi:hypothetical protein